MFFAGCSADSGTENDQGLKLKDVYSIPIGAAVAAGEYGWDSFDTYGDALMGEFDSLVAENCMKAGVIQYSEGNFSWTAPDRLVGYAAEHGMQVRGHALVWHTQAAGWMFTDTGTAAEKKEFSRSRMQTHITTVVNRYEDDIYCWDVVNEAISDSGGYRTDSPWYLAYGDASYIQNAFDYAYAADPDCKLYYNDYNVCVPSKRSDIVSMIEDLDLIGSHHLTGIGIQAHWNLNWPSIAEIQTTIDTFHDMGLEVQITELDIDCYNGSTSLTVNPYSNYEEALATRYGEIFDCLRQNAEEGKITAITLWGVADDHTWLDHMIGGEYISSVTRKNYPLLFDADHNKKQAYFEVWDF
jgi:endo-1,4-beta-xylanase